MSTPALFIPIEDICEWLEHSTVEVFQTMFNAEAFSVPAPNLTSSGEDLVVGSIGFVGDTNGDVFVYATDGFAKRLTARVLELPEAEIESEMVNDVIGELSNMVVGAVKSRICDRGVFCVMTIPSIVRGNGLKIESVGPSQKRRLGFQCGEDQLLLEVSLKITK